MPYGFRTKLFTIIDTEEDNYFPPFSAESIGFIAKYIEMVLPHEYKSYFEEGLLRRIEVSGEEADYKNLSLQELLMSALFKKNMNIQQVLAVPEQDSWTYSDGSAYSSSTLIVAMFKAAGLFDVQQIINEPLRCTKRSMHYLA